MVILNPLPPFIQPVSLLLIQTKSWDAIWIDIFNARRTEKFSRATACKTNGSCVIVKSPEAAWCVWVCAIISPFAFNLHAYKSNFLPLLDLGHSWRMAQVHTGLAHHAPRCVCECTFMLHPVFFVCYIFAAHFASRARKAAAGMNKIWALGWARSVPSCLGQPVFVNNEKIWSRRVRWFHLFQSSA